MIYCLLVHISLDNEILYGLRVVIIIKITYFKEIYFKTRSVNGSETLCEFILYFEVWFIVYKRTLTSFDAKQLLKWIRHCQVTYQWTDIIIQICITFSDSCYEILDGEYVYLLPLNSVLPLVLWFWCLLYSLVENPECNKYFSPVLTGVITCNRCLFQLNKYWCLITEILLLSHSCSGNIVLNLVYEFKQSAVEDLYFNPVCTHKVFSVFPRGCLVAASSCGLSPYSGFPNCPRPRLEQLLTNWLSNSVTH
jgi:hypothetical protein